MTNPSLHIGLNCVDPAIYGGWSGDLLGCHNDALAMARIAAMSGFTPSYQLLDSEATIRRVSDALSVLASDATPGSTVLISYSGHGGQVSDLNRDESDGLDETWCLYDGMFLDDHIHAALAKFKKGVRVIVVSDSCHSGTVIRRLGLIGPPRSIKCAPSAAIRAAITAEEQALDIRAWPQKRPRVKASAILLSGCADNQFSWDGTTNGLFTEKMLAAYDFGAFSGGYTAFRKAIVKRMPQEQTPQLFTLGAKNEAFLKGKPFSTL